MNNAISEAPHAGADKPCPPVLAAKEAGRRAGLLCDLQAALAAQGVSAVLARHHRLVLRGGRSPCEPSGPTDPQLHVFTPAGTRIITTDGTSYLHGDGTVCPADDPARAARPFRPGTRADAQNEPEYHLPPPGGQPAHTSLPPAMAGAHGPGDIRESGQ
jgi:hypothetical protein